jgi:hypothetical protein
MPNANCEHCGTTVVRAGTVRDATMTDRASRICPARAMMVWP